MVGTETAPKKHISPGDIAQNLDVHPSAPIRWMRRGILLSDSSRVYLKHLRLPGGFRTTQEWLDEFLSVVADDKAGKIEDAPKSAARPESERIGRMNAALAAAGF